MNEKSMDWVDEFIARISVTTNDILEVEINGVKIAAIISKELRDFFSDNKDLLREVGKEHFKAFLLYIHQKKEEEAFMVLLQKMSVDQMIATLKGEAASLAMYNAKMETFISKLKKFVVSSLLPITAKVLFAVLLG